MSSGTLAAVNASNLYENQSMDNSTMDESKANGSNVSRLKNVFQQGGGHNTKVSNSQVTERSPDIKRKRGVYETESQRTQNTTQKSPGTIAIDPNNMDPQTFFKKTNHVQRFQYTRAIFAKMAADQTQEKRGSSPGRQQQVTSPTSPTTRNQRLLSAPEIGKPRASSDPSKMDLIAGKQRHHSQHEDKQMTDPNRSHWPRPKRTGSLENLLQEDLHLQSTEGEYNLISNSDLDVTSPVEHTDDKRDRSDSDVVSRTVPDPKWLMKKYETEAHKGGGQSASPPKSNRYLKSENKENRDWRSKTSPHSEKDSDTTIVNERINVEKSVPSKQDEQQTSYDSGDTISSKFNQESSYSTHLQSNRFLKEDNSADNVYKPVYRRYNHGEPEQAVNKADSGVVLRPKANRGDSSVLLKRRPRDDKKRLSKEEIEASLSEADEYWQKTHGEQLPEIDTKMSESTYSSGSGEEMARSDSNYDLDDSSNSPLADSASSSRRTHIYSFQNSQESPDSNDDVIDHHAGTVSIARDAVAMHNTGSHGAIRLSMDFEPTETDGDQMDLSGDDPFTGETDNAFRPSSRNSVSTSGTSDEHSQG